MNLLWIVALALLVAIEKLAPKGDLIARLLGGYDGRGYYKLDPDFTAVTAEAPVSHDHFDECLSG